MPRLKKRGINKPLDDGVLAGCFSEKKEEKSGTYNDGENSINSKIRFQPLKQIKVPSQFLEKYEIGSLNHNSTYQNDNSSGELLTNVFREVNDSMRSYSGRKHYLSNQRNSHHSSGSLFTNRKDSSVASVFRGGSKLPLIYSSYPLKVILNKKHFKELEREEINKEIQMKKDMNKGIYKFREENVNTNDEVLLRHSFNNYVKSEIPSENVNLITYLNIDNKIKAPYLQRISEYSNDHLKKLNKICQKVIRNKELEKNNNDLMKSKIRSKYVQIQTNCNRYLNDMRSALDSSNFILTKSKVKLPVHKAQKTEMEKYYDQNYKLAEKNWHKFDTVRYFHGRIAPRGSVLADKYLPNFNDYNEENGERNGDGKEDKGEL